MLDADSCYDAIASRDRRFEGRFVVGVRTTGVYCRPGCPAPLPKKKNVDFYACAAAAEDAGFRPCMRCRPETSPGTPAWLGTSATVSRALRLIADGALDDGDLDALAARLGVGARHLRRLFAEHLGASPIAVACTRRVHFARKLIDETRLPMAEVAMGAGFSSVRRFNDAIRRTFRKPPRALRSGGARVGAGTPRVSDEADAHTLTLSLPVSLPYDYDGVLAFLAARAIPGVEVVAAGAYRRTTTRGSLEVTFGGDRLRLALDGADATELLGIAARIERVFDVAADRARIGAHLAKDPRLARAVAARPGLRVPGAWDGFELAVRAILGQQISVKGATELAGRLVVAFGESADTSTRDGLTHRFPKPEVLATAEVSRIGMPRARGECIRALAAAVASGALSFETSCGLDDTVARLEALPGIGPWTAHYIAMRAFAEPDAFPTGDLGLRRAMGGVSARELDRSAEAWRPWRAYAAMHLWMEETT